MNMWIQLGVVVGVVVVVVLVVAMWSVSVSNTEVRLSNAIKSKVSDNQSEFDNMWKKINQVAQVPKAKMKALKDIFMSHSAARGGGTEKGGSLATWLQESVPAVNDTTFDNLMNAIAASLDRWTFQQKEIVDLIREYNNLFQFPASIIMHHKGKTKLDPDTYIITSERSKQAWDSKRDEDVKLDL